MNYIQRRDGRTLETVDQFDTRKEARAMLAEYRQADPYASYYLSGRACKDWRDSEPPAPTFPTNGGTRKARNGGRRAPLDLSPRLNG